MAERGHNWSFEWGGQRSGQQEYVPSVRSLAPSDTGWHNRLVSGDTAGTVSMTSHDHP